MTKIRSDAGQGKLKRVVTLIPLIAIMIGLNIGGSLFLITGIAAGLTGPSLFIAQLISAAPILLAIIPYLVLTSAIPTTCANYHYAKLFSRPLAVAAWMGLFIAIPVGAFPLFAIATGKLRAVLLPGTPVIAAAIAVMPIVYAVKSLGVKSAAYIQLRQSRALFRCWSLSSGVRPSTCQPTPQFTALSQAIGGSSLIYTLLRRTFRNRDRNEIKNARNTIPKALIISMAIVLVLYLFIEVVAVGVMDWKVFSKETLGGPAGMFLSGFWLDFFVIGGGILASVTTINLTLTVAGRYALALQRRVLP
jgi:APA family basic amino acid/polyamine antiporter